MAGILKVDRVQSDSNLAFQVGSSNVAYFNTTGMNLSGGEIIAGGSTLRTTSGMIYANNGIAFPATQASSADANTLDDYEEGSWTPNFYFAGGQTASTQGYTSGRYVKIGKQVTCWFFINCSSINSGSGQAYIIGLPFTPQNVIGAQEGSSLCPNYWSNWASAVIPGGYVQYNLARLLLTNIDAATIISAITASSMTNSSTLYGNFTYFTD